MASKLVIQNDHEFLPTVDIMEVESIHDGVRITITEGYNEEQKFFRAKASIVIHGRIETRRILSYLHQDHGEY